MCFTICFKDWPWGWLRFCYLLGTQKENWSNSRHCSSFEILKSILNYCSGPTKGRAGMFLFSVVSPIVFLVWLLEWEFQGLCRLRTSLCLQFKPHHIAAGAIFLAAKFLKVKLPAEGDKAWWQEFEVNPRQLEGASLLLLLFLFVLMKLQRAV